MEKLFVLIAFSIAICFGCRKFGAKSSELYPKYRKQIYQTYRPNEIKPKKEMKKITKKNKNNYRFRNINIKYTATAPFINESAIIHILMELYFCFAPLDVFVLWFIFFNPLCYAFDCFNAE